jgi:hypothetical protein
VAGVFQQILKAFLVLNIAISYQYLGMTKIVGALNMLPKTFLREGIVNPSTQKAIKIYRTDGNWVFQQILKAFLVLNIGKCYH